MFVSYVTATCGKAVSEPAEMGSTCLQSDDSDGIRGGKKVKKREGLVEIMSGRTEMCHREEGE